jgi:hypothetical protein
MNSFHLNNNVVQYFVFHVFHKKTFLNWHWGELIIDFIYWANEAHQLLLPWVL